jgi:hypothetical protein
MSDAQNAFVRPVPAAELYTALQLDLNAPQDAEIHPFITNQLSVEEIDVLSSHLIRPEYAAGCDILNPGKARHPSARFETRGALHVERWRNAQHGEVLRRGAHRGV